MLSSTFFPFLALSFSLVPFTTAHFKLVYPPARGFDEDILGTFPCGGQPESASPLRTVVSSTSFPVALDMGHDRAVIQMLLAIGNQPGDHFNIVLERTFQQEGLGNFCLPHVFIPSGLNITDGTNATLQVVTDGEGGGGLYNCADITFTAATEQIPSSCTNGTGVTASPLPSNEAVLNANETNADGTPQNGASTSTGAGGSGATGSSTNQAAVLTVTWGALGAALLGAAALL